MSQKINTSQIENNLRPKCTQNQIISMIFTNYSFILLYRNGANMCTNYRNCRFVHFTYVGQITNFSIQLQHIVVISTYLLYLQAKFTCPQWTDCPLNVLLKKLSCFSFELNENWWICSYTISMCTKTSPSFINSNEKQKSFFNDTFN